MTACSFPVPQRPSIRKSGDEPQVPRLLGFGHYLQRIARPQLIQRSGRVVDWYGRRRGDGDGDGPVP